MKKHIPVKRRCKRKCLHCKDLFLVDYRNVRHQLYCSKPECRKASKKASQEKYLASEKGRGTFKGEVNVNRVREWRKAHPDYWKVKRNIASSALQDDCFSQSISNQPDTSELKVTTLQDVCFTQPALLIGLIASLTGNALQDDIAETLRRFIDLGHDILGVIP